MLIGYARVSTEDQTLDLQLDALNKAGCERIFQDTISGSSVKREGLEQAFEYLRRGDTLVVWKLDRLGRNLKHLVTTIEDLAKGGIGFQSIRENIDLSTPAGKLYFHLFCSLAEFERDLIRERTLAGLAAARARGRKGGREHALTPQKIKAAVKLAADPDLSIKEICRVVGCSKATYYRWIHPEIEKQKSEVIACMQSS